MTRGGYFGMGVVGVMYWSLGSCSVGWIPGDPVHGAMMGNYASRARDYALGRLVVDVSCTF